MPLGTVIAYVRALRSRRNVSAGSNFWKSAASDLADAPSWPLHELGAPQRNTIAMMEAPLMVRSSDGATLTVLLNGIMVFWRTVPLPASYAHCRANVPLQTETARLPITLNRRSRTLSNLHHFWGKAPRRNERDGHLTTITAILAFGVRSSAWCRRC